MTYQGLQSSPILTWSIICIKSLHLVLITCISHVNFKLGLNKINVAEYQLGNCLIIKIIPIKVYPF